MRIIDLSRELYHRTPSYPGQPPVIHGVWKTHAEAYADSGNVHGNSVMYFSMPDHGGTHIDAPRHFGKDATPIDEYPLENCIVDGICIDLRHIAPRAEIAPADPDESPVANSSPPLAPSSAPPDFTDTEPLAELSSPRIDVTDTAPVLTGVDSAYEKRRWLDCAAASKSTVNIR